ncbi:hypothetical protein JXA12_04545 [Candidatus Woesearchaeota archaeon]|nr:hypothetical protein [Candidatus Woesearchaeota archaeon]
MAPACEEEQRNKKGINNDYLNEFNELATALHGFKQFSAIKPLRLYHERYDPAQHPYLITQKNERRVRRINDLVTEINTLIERGEEDKDKYRALTGRTIFWARGAYHSSYPRDKLRYAFPKKP